MGSKVSTPINQESSNSTTSLSTNSNDGSENEDGFIEEVYLDASDNLPNSHVVYEVPNNHTVCEQVADQEHVHDHEQMKPDPAAPNQHLEKAIYGEHEISTVSLADEITNDEQNIQKSSGKVGEYDKVNEDSDNGGTPNARQFILDYAPNEEESTVTLLLDNEDQNDLDGQVTHRDFNGKQDTVELQTLSILEQFPGADFSFIYETIMNAENTEEAVRMVIEGLKQEFQGNIEEITTMLMSMLIEQREMVSQNRNVNSIEGAEVQQNVDPRENPEPSDVNRAEVEVEVEGAVGGVVEESIDLMQESMQSEIISSEALDAQIFQLMVDAQCSQQHFDSVLQLMKLFAHADPFWIFNEVTEKETNLDDIIEKLSDPGGDYPRRRSRLKKMVHSHRRQVLQNPAFFNIKNFLKMYKHPAEHFGDETRQVSDLYKNHALVCLKTDQDFLSMSEAELETSLSNHNYHFYPAYTHLQAMIMHEKREHEKVYKAGPRMLLSNDEVDTLWPEELDETFFKELQFCLFGREIVEYQNEMAVRRMCRMDDAEKLNCLVECCCCCDPVLPEETTACMNPSHICCYSCLVSHSQVQLGDGKYEIRCIGEDCQYIYSKNVLKHVLDPKLFDLVIKRTQQEELRNANIENLVFCPFCDFAVSFEGTAGKVLNCLNIECCKVSCLDCKKENHLPLACNAVNEDAQTAYRTFIENRMAEALIKKCPSCDKGMVKETGCNHMTCPCGTHLCYLCGKQMDGANPYAHFSDGTEQAGGTADDSLVSAFCTLYTQNERTHHEERVRNAGNEAHQEYLRQHPEMKDVQINVDELVKGGDAAMHMDPNGAHILHELIGHIRERRIDQPGNQGNEREDCTIM